MFYEFNLRNDVMSSIQELSSHLESSDVSINISCDSNVDAIFNSLSDLDFHLAAISSVYSKYNYTSIGKLTLDYPENLSPITIAKLLANKNFVLMLSDQSFKTILAINEEIARFILLNDHLRQRLNDIDPAKDTQTLPYSCTARAIMIAMTKMDLLDAPSRSKELEIYLDICEQYGQPANAAKIVKFFEHQNINVRGVEIRDVLTATLGCLILPTSSKPHLGSNPLLAAYSLFSRSLPHRRSIAKSSDHAFPNDTLALMVTQNHSETGSHVIFCEKREDKYHIINPSNGRKNEYASLKDLMELKGGLGVFYFVAKQKVLENKSTTIKKCMG